MNHPFPADTQRRFEAAVLEGVYAAGRVVTSAELAADLETTEVAAAAVLAASYRKGLVQPAAGGDRSDRCDAADRFEVRGITARSLDSLFQHTERAGLKPTSAVRDVTVEPATAIVAEKLDLPAGAPVYVMVRTRNVGGQVIANQTNYIPIEICPGLENDDLSHFSFQKLLEDKYHTVIIDLAEAYRLEPASESDCAVLGLAPGDQVLIVERLSFSTTHRPVVWACIHIHPGRYPSVASLWPEAGKLLAPGAG